MKQVDEILIGHCQRGCRLFDILFIQNPMFVKFDVATAFTSCHNCKLTTVHNVPIAKLN